MQGRKELSIWRCERDQAATTSRFIDVTRWVDIRKHEKFRSEEILGQRQLAFSLTPRQLIITILVQTEEVNIRLHMSNTQWFTWICHQKYFNNKGIKEPISSVLWNCNLTSKTSKFYPRLTFLCSLYKHSSTLCLGITSNPILLLPQPPITQESSSTLSIVQTW